MKQKQKLFLNGVLWLLSMPVMAYEIETHEELSKIAVEASRIARDPSLLKDLGVSPTQKFINSEGDELLIPELFQAGASFEDKLSPTNLRPVNHFYNPLNGSGLDSGVIKGKPSPDWALEDRGEITGTLGFGEQKFSFQDGREFFYQALTGRDSKGTIVAPTKKKRDEYFGLTFQTLGQVIHHVQDMAQPQHVRNDAHLGLDKSETTLLCIVSPALCAGYFAIRDPSLYESWTNRNDVRRSLPTDFSLIGYDLNSSKFIETFNQPRKFWASTTGEGLAQFTNANFISEGTNFNNQGMFNFPLFTPSLQNEMDIQQLCSNAKPACLNSNLKGMMTFYGNWVEDRYTGQKTLNPFASTRSIFDADLNKINAKQSFTLNRFNFELTHGFVIPRAVAYSAGLINYFFRGKIDFIEDKKNPGKYVIKNLSPEDMQGTFTLYYDAEDGNRYPVAGDTSDKTWANIAIAKNSQVDNLSFKTPTNPTPRERGKYMLVFNGNLGAEKEVPGITRGAIAAKEVGFSEPDFYIAPSADGNTGRLGRFSSDGKYLDLNNMAGRGGFIYGLMTYGADTYHVDQSWNGRLPSYAIKNGVTFHTQVAALNDIAGNGKEIFVVASDGYVDPVVSVYDMDGRFLRSFSILPQYAYQGGFVQLVASGSTLIATANFTMNFYNTGGAPLLTLDLGQNVYESILAASRDRVYRANFRESLVEIYDFNGAVKGSVSVPALAKITCMDATDNKLYVVTSDSVGYPPYNGRIHVFSRNAGTDIHSLTTETSIPVELDSWHHGCSVSRSATVQ